MTRPTHRPGATMDQQDKDQPGFEGDVSDKAGDRLGGGAAGPIEVEDVPAAPTPEP